MFRNRLPIALLILLLCASSGYCQIDPDPVGDYLVKGGVGLFSIVRDESGELAYRDYYFLDKYGDGKMTLEYVRPQLFVSVALQEEHADWLERAKGDLVTQIQFSPSRDIGGNWDLVFLDVPWKRTSDIAPFTGKIESFLHRVDDSRIVDYFDIIEQIGDMENPNDFSEDLLNLSRDIIEDHPKDRAIRTLYFDALLRNAAREELATAVEKWKGEYQDSDDYPSIIYQRTKHGLRGLTLSQEGRNGYDFFVNLFDESRTFDERVRDLPKVLEYEEYIRPVSLIPDWYLANHLQIQTTMKTVRVEADLLCLQGRRDQAMQLHLSSSYAGVLLSEDKEQLLNLLVSIATQGIAYSGLGVFVENCCISSAHLNPILELLERISRKMPAFREEDVWDFYSVRMDECTHITEPVNFPQVVVRNNVLVSELQSLRAVVAAKLYLSDHGEFPDQIEQIEPMFPEGLPKDPFGDTIRYRKTQEGCVAYSIGPDSLNNGAMIVYDPTNGTVSEGDVIFPIAEKPRYPIPAWGVRAKSAQDLLSRFPNGLPPDPFNSNGTAPLTVRETDRVYIYSFGPDNVDTWLRRGLSNAREPIAYDPTNGVISEGDIFFVVPKP